LSNGNNTRLNGKRRLYAVPIHFKNEAPALNAHIDLQLYHYGYQNCLPKHSWGPGIKDHYKIHLIFEGKGLYRLGSQTFELETGQLFLTTPDTVAHYIADETHPWTYAWFAFEGLSVKAYLQRAGLSAQSPVIKLSAEGLATSKVLIESMMGTDPNHFGKDLVLMGFLYQLLGLLIGSAPSDANSEVSSIKTLYLESAMAYVQMNYSRKMTCEEMASHIGIHRKYLARLFKENLRTSPQAYLIDYRMEKAKQLLEETYLSVSEVAVSVGYHDPLVFSKTFKKHVGKSPTVFKKSEFNHHKE
jgi:AraC-like DNA-binding protein